MQTIAAIDWTLVVNFDNDGIHRGYDTVEDAEAYIARERANGADINELWTTDRAGLRIRIVRILDTICVFPAECDDCGAPVTSIKWVTDEHHAKCPRRDPHF